MKASLHIAMLLSAGATHIALAAGDGGLASLQARLGSSCPTGSGIGIVQVEAPMTGGGSDYAPNLTLSDFAGKNVILATQPAVAGWHGTNVAQRLYGSGMSMARGATDVWVYNLNSWLTDLLKLGTGSTPAASPSTLVRVMNHSWLGSYGAGMEAYDREAVRRLDYQMTRDGILATCGENNGAGSVRAPMMADTFNGVSVGRADLQHSAGDTGSASDSPGRMKPDLVAPGQFTSFSTASVGSAAALLFEVLKDPAYAALSNAQRAQVAKICLLGGADRAAPWANNAPVSGASRGVATKPLDAMRGCGELNVDTAHRMLTSTRVNGAAGATAASPAEPWGWGTATLTGLGKSYWRFRLYQPQPQMDITLTWPRNVTSTATSFTVANLNMRLTRSLGGGSTLIPLEGDAGAATFESGNVSSQSGVDNVEVIHAVNLQPGEYTLEVSRADAGTAMIGYLGWSTPSGGFGMEGDVDGNGLVDYGDLAFAMLSYGADDPLCDMDANGLVDYGDIAIILLDFN